METSHDEPHYCTYSIFIADRTRSDYADKVNSFYKDVHVKNLIVNYSNKGYLQVLGNMKINNTLTRRNIMMNKHNRYKKELRFD